MHFLICSWLTGRRPEFTDPKVVAQGEGREGKLGYNVPQDSHHHDVGFCRTL